MPQNWIMGRYHAPVIHSNRQRVTGYNAQRQRSALAPQMNSAEVQQDAREEHPVLNTPPPAPPVRIPQSSPGGLQVAPDIAEQLAQPVPGGDFGNEVFNRHVPAKSPGLPTALAAPPLEAPDIAGLAEDPLPLTPGERAGSAIASAASMAHLDPTSPDFHSAIPGLVGIGHEAIKSDLAQPKESEAQRAVRNANAGLIGARIANVNANTTEVAPNAQAHRGLQNAQAGAATGHANESAARVPLINAQTTTEGARANELRTRQWKEAAGVAIQRYGLDAKEVAARLAAAMKDQKFVNEQPSPGWFKRAIGQGGDIDARKAAAAKNVEDIRGELDHLKAPDVGAPPSDLVQAADSGEREALDAAKKIIASGDTASDDYKAAVEFLKERGQL